MPTSSSVSADGSSSMTIAMLLMASRKWSGIDASASSTHARNSSRVMASFASLSLRGRRLGAKLLVVPAVRTHLAPVAQRLGPAHAAPVQNERIGRLRPSRGRQQSSQLLLRLDRIIGRRHEPDSIRHSQHVAVDGQARNPERMPQHHVGRFAPDARAVSPALPSCSGSSPPCCSTTASAIVRRLFDFMRKNPVG